MQAELKKCDDELANAGLQVFSELKSKKYAQNQKASRFSFLPRRREGSLSNTAITLGSIVKGFFCGVLLIEGAASDDRLC